MTNETDNPQRTWWVNQNITHVEEREAAVLWASKSDRRGGHLQHHTNMRDLRQGNRVIHYAQRAMRGVSIVIAPAEDGPRPYRHADRELNNDGYLVRITYHVLPHPVDRDAIPLEWRVLESPAFNGKGRSQQGYLFPLSQEFVARLDTLFPELSQVAK